MARWWHDLKTFSSDVLVANLLNYLVANLSQQVRINVDLTT